MERILSYTVTEKHSGMTVEQLLRKELHISSGLIRKMKQIPGGIVCNQKPIRVIDRVSKDDILSLTVESKGENSNYIVPTDGKLDIVYEDPDILILNKPAGIPVHPSQGHFTDSLANLVMGYYHKNNQPFVFRAVNRLDRGTSGLMAVAKHAYAQDLLTKQLQNGTLKRTYYAVVVGRILPPCGVLEFPISRKIGSTIKREVNPNGMPAVTNYWTLKEKNGYTLLQIQLETGRTHQIRVHFSHIGHPLVGDFLYGTESSEFPNCHALFSGKLTLVHPVAGGHLQFEKPIPDAMLQLLR